MMAILRDIFPECKRVKSSQNYINNVKKKLGTLKLNLASVHTTPKKYEVK